MVYAPVVGRLDCGAFPSDPQGFWQENGYGILSVFKADWDSFGGVYEILQNNLLKVCCRQEFLMHSFYINYNNWPPILREIC